MARESRDQRLARKYAAQGRESASDRRQASRGSAATTFNAGEDFRIHGR